MIYNKNHGDIANERIAAMGQRPNMWAYMQGYRGVVWPRFIRRAIAKTTLHYYWLAGNMGSFGPDGGVCSRSEFLYR